MASLGMNGAAAATSFINMKLMQQGSYFILSADAQPLLHYWSLAVEEQFYIVFPLYLYAVMRFERAALPVTLGLAALSFATCVALTPGHQPLAFYALPTRAWELLLGSSLAIYRFRGGRVTCAVAAGSVWVGLALVACSIAFLREAYGFPGWIAGFPVIGTALLLAPAGDARNGPMRLLALPAMVAIGKRSYSLYLWHWPVFSLIDYHLFASSEALRIPLKIVLTVVLTTLSYRFIERPARAYLNIRQRRVPMFFGTALLVAAIAGGGLWLRANLYFDVSAASLATGGMVVHGGDKAVVVLSGDSQAAMYGTEIASIARAQGFTLNALGTAGRNQLPDELDTSWPTAAMFIAKTKPDLVILVNSWAKKLNGDPRAVEKALREMSDQAKQVLIVTQPPVLSDTVSREALRNGAQPPFREPEIERRARVASVTLLGRLAGPTVAVIDIAGIFTDPRGNVILIGQDGRLTYFDPHHLSDSGTAMTRAVLDDAIVKALARAGPRHSR